MGDRRKWPTFSFFSIKNILIFSYLLIAVLIIVTFASVTIKVSGTIIKEKESKAVLNRLKNVEDHMNASIQKYSDVMMSLVYEENTQDLLKHFKSMPLEKQLKLASMLYQRMNEANIVTTEIGSIYVLDKFNNRYSFDYNAFTRDEMLSHFEFSTWYSAVADLKGGVYIDYSGRILNNPELVTFARSIVDGNSEIGVILLSVKKEAFAAFLGNGENGNYVSVMDRQHVQVIDSNRNNWNSPSPFETSFLEQDGVQGSSEPNIGGVDYWATYLKNEKYGYTLISMVPEKELLKDVAYFKRVTVYAVMIILLSVMLLSHFLSKSLVRPVNKLVSLMNRVEQGDLNSKMNKIPANELGILADQFNRMVGRLKESVPLRRERFFSKLLFVRLDESDYIQEAGELGIRIADKNNFAAIFEFQEHDLNMNRFNIRMLESFLSAELEKAGAEAYLYVFDSRKMILVAGFERQSQREETLEALHKALNVQLGVKANIGAGSVAAGFESIRNSYQEALSALNYTFFLGENEIIYSNDIKHTDYDYEMLEHLEDDIADAVMYMEKNRLMEKMNQLFAAFREKYIKKEIINFSILNIYLKSLKNASGLGANVNAIHTDRLGVIEQIHGSDRIDESREALLQLLTDMIDAIAAGRDKKMNDLVVKAIRTIDMQYADSGLSVAKMAKELFVSENYLSKLFKNETGENFSQYLMKVRMDHAKKLLETTDSKIGEVAELVGYNDANYFSTCFKTVVGGSPAKYRSAFKLNAGEDSVT